MPTTASVTAIYTHPERIHAGIGRPHVSRVVALEQVKALRHVGRHRVVVHRGRLAGDLRCSVRTIGRILAELERDGFFERVRRRGHDGVVVEYVGPPRAIPADRRSRTAHLSTPVDLLDYGPR